MSSDNAAAGGAAGGIARVLRYPVKSARGQDVGSATLVETGLVGDRGFAIIDDITGRVASAKSPRQWRALLGLTALIPIDSPPEDWNPEKVRLQVTFPDGAVVEGVGAELDEALSRLLGRRVRLAATPPSVAVLDRAVPDQVFDAGLDAEVDVEALTMGQASPAGTFVDYAPIHLITTAALDRISDLVGHRVDPRRYRPNLVVDTGGSGTGFVENGWVGRILAVGSTAQLRIIMGTPRCAVPTLDHGGGRALEVVRTLSAHNRLWLEEFGWQPCAGVYAQTLQPGPIAVGDTVRILDDRTARNGAAQEDSSPATAQKASPSPSPNTATERSP